MDKNGTTSQEDDDPSPKYVISRVVVSAQLLGL